MPNATKPTTVTVDRVKWEYRADDWWDERHGRFACESERPFLDRTASDAEKIAELVEALTKIEACECAYSRDPLTHARNAVEHMRSLATDALKRATDA